MTKEIMSVESQVDMFAKLDTVAKEMIKSGLLPPTLNTPEKVKVVIVTGKELGMPMMEACQRIQVISGKPALSPQGMMALIERSGVLEDFKVNSQKDFCEVTMARKGRSPYTARFGKEEATAMWLINKDNYKKQAQTMYRWRAIAACARVVCPDVIGGMYLAEEVASHTDVEETIGVVEKTAAITDNGKSYDEWRDDFFTGLEDDLAGMKEPFQVKQWERSHTQEIGTLFDADRDIVGEMLEERQSQLIRGEDAIPHEKQPKTLEDFKTLAKNYKTPEELRAWFKSMQDVIQKNLKADDFTTLISHLKELCETMDDKDGKLAELAEYLKSSKGEGQLNQRIVLKTTEIDALEADARKWLDAEIESIRETLKQ